MPGLKADSHTWREMAKKANTTVDKVMEIDDVVTEYRDREELRTKSSPEERGYVKRYLEGLNGELNEDMPIAEILTNSGVPIKRGTIQYAIRKRKQLLLSYRARNQAHGEPSGQ
jgi:hypothetical protein